MAAIGPEKTPHTSCDIMDGAGVQGKRTGGPRRDDCGNSKAWSKRVFLRTHNMRNT